MRARAAQVCHSQRHSLTTGRSSDTFDAPEVADHGNLQRPPNTSHAPAQPRAAPHHEQERRPNDPLARAINDVFLQHPHPLPAVDTAVSNRRPSHDLSQSHLLRPADPPNRLPDDSHATDSINPTTLRHSGQEDLLNDYAQGHQTPDDHSQVVDSEDEDEHTMPTRRTSTVDLTQSPNRAAPSASQQSRTRRRSSAVDEADEAPVRKRSKRVAASAARVDLEEEEEDEAPSADTELLQAQQRDALKMQDSNEDDGAKIGQKSCIICLENYTNATTSSCGRHIRTVNLMIWNEADNE